MARIAGVDIPNAKRIEAALTYIYGIGLSSSRKILAETGINPDIRVKDLSEEEVNKVRDYTSRKKDHKPIAVVVDTEKAKQLVYIEINEKGSKKLAFQTNFSRGL